MKKTKLSIIAAISFIVLLIGFILLASPAKRFPNAATSKIIRFFDSPYLGDLGYNLVEARKSILKIGNIRHFPFWFRETSLPQFSLVIKDQNLRVMNEALPDRMYSEYFQIENKKFVPAQFSHDNFSQDVEIRYRGRGSNNWNGSKRSLLLKFPKGKLFNEVKSFDLLFPEGREYTIELLNEERLKRHGLITRKSFPVRLNINNRDAGVYIAKERFSKQWLELSGLPEMSKIFSVSSALRDFQYNNNDIPYSDVFSGWKEDIYEQDIHSYDSLATLKLIQAHPDNKNFAQLMNGIFASEDWYTAVAINVMAGQMHSMSQMNLLYLFNAATGKFYPLLEDITIASPQRPMRKEPNPFDFSSYYILADASHYKNFQKILKEISSDENLRKDLEYFDRVNADFLPEIYRDQTKNRGDLYVENSIQKLREWVKGNHLRAQNFANIPEPPLARQPADLEYDQLSLPGSFKYLYDTILSPAEFTARHPEFKIENGDIILTSGSYTFRENIIIPKNTRLVVRPGVKIYFAEKASLISYSPVSAIGTKEWPIVIGRLDVNKNWGSFAAINTKNNSEFSNIIMIGGSSSEEINGVTFTGMLAAHNAPIAISNSEFRNDADDDAVNIKYTTGEIINSKFIDNAGDALDLDATEDFKVTNNVFKNTGNSNFGGDAIDISFSNAIVEKNHINDCQDKGISVGEKSTPRITDNSISGCAIGIAVKDLSEASIENNKLIGNEIGVFVYQKKGLFGGGKAILKNNEFSKNQIDKKNDDHSEIVTK